MSQTDIADVTPDELRQRATEVLQKARDKSLTLGTAESCTGGLVSGTLTAIPGSSDVVMGSVVSYACSVKHRVLGVSQETLDTVGAVSQECACQMAEGARRVLASDVAVSVTGIAGPGGAVPGKPVGTVWFACACEQGTVSERHEFSGNRDTVRAKTVACALDMLAAACDGAC
jgi:nicotinamide-nucleotide amidase